MSEQPIPQQELLNRVYKGFTKTGDNVDGIVILPYTWDGANWQREPAGLFPLQYDELAFTNADENGNYQTITSLLSGVAQNVLTLTYDGNSNVTDIHKTT